VEELQEILTDLQAKLDSLKNRSVYVEK
jgi:hypothetical protein